MRAPVAEPDVSIGPLEQGDGLTLRRWLGTFLRAHNRAWVDARGLGWSDAEIDAQVVATDLVGDHWAWLQRAAVRPTDVVLVARRGSLVVGCVWAGERLDDHLRTPTGVLNWIYVDPAVRGERVGRRLVDAAKRWMADRGLRSVMVSVLDDNAAARALYQSAGLQVADVRMMGPLTGGASDA